MEVPEVTVGVRDVGGGCVSSSSNGLKVPVNGVVMESENLGDDLLQDLDSYLDDINVRLTISRMVGDSVMKGVMKAVEQVAAEKIAVKELEVVKLKEVLRSCQVGDDKSESSGSLVVYHELRSEENGSYGIFSDALAEHDKMRVSLGSLRNAAKGLIKSLKKEIDSIKGCSSMRRINSGSELLGLGGILQEKASESFVGVDKTLDTLKMTLDTMCTQVDDMVKLTKMSLHECWQEQEFQGEIEAMVMQSSVRSLHEEFEGKLWDQNAIICSSQSTNLVERINEVSNLKKELDVILKSLSHPETGSHDMDHFIRKGLSNHVSSSTSLWEGNGIFEESKNGMPENWEAAQLKHLSKDEIVNYFNNMITTMKRNHESKVLQMIEECFSLKREFLKEKGSSLPFRKDKDLDILRRKIPEVISKLDGILVENEKLSTLSNNCETIDSLKDRLNSLLLENRQLMDSLSDKRKELKCTSSQLSDATEKILQHSLQEAALLKLIGNLESAVEDGKIQATVSEEVYKCVLRELTYQVIHNAEELEMQSIVMQEVYEILYKEAVEGTEVCSKREIDDFDIEFLIKEGLCAVIFRDSVKDAQSQISDLSTDYLHENDNRVSLELKVLEKTKELDLIKGELSDAVKQIEVDKVEIKNLKDHVGSQEAMLAKESEELDLVKRQLADVMEQIEVGNQKLELMANKVSEADEQRNKLLAVIQEKQNAILSLEVKENELQKQMKVAVDLILGISRALSDFECRVAEGFKKNNLRLEESTHQLISLIQKTSTLKRTKLLYKQKLERRCADLRTAEAEVDLLGDEVDTLLSLLEKIYIALDHYSPILRHYPGIIEILKLVKRELSGEACQKGSAI
ncbi:WPP domain-associated protein [Diospyros lotus]|uniref:WPP domain-associated protein n=1 Tax=Diospyros lotus TaxID=55363 RepID=UPI002255FFCB|nr:WPP domain-associated protein [Diospyros lotus]XP_052179541.1 WPP domain-associated protein [Diospyros lotus]XP_052179542.1 WPP domain-associated protein [Diospyros lotus]